MHDYASNFLVDGPGPRRARAIDGERICIHACMYTHIHHHSNANCVWWAGTGMHDHVLNHLVDAPLRDGNSVDGEEAVPHAHARVVGVPARLMQH